MGKQTIDNLKKAFEGESMARNKYTFYASVARNSGQLKIAEIFEETAKNEKEHAEIILKLLKGIRDNPANLQAAIEGETFEYTDLYPEMARVAREEGETEAARFFEEVSKVEKHHAQRFQEVLNMLQNNTLMKKDASNRWRCRECGYIHEGTEPPGKCPLCGHEGYYYELDCKCL